MTDASLRLKVDSSTAKTASSDLDRMTAASKRAEDQFAKIERAARMSGQANKDYAAALGQAYNIQGKLSGAQVSAIRQYETLIGKTQLLVQGRGREAAQFDALRKAGATANTQYGRTIAMLAGGLYDLEQQQNKTDKSASNFASTLTRRFVAGYVVSQLKQMASSVISLNAELAKTGDVGRFTGLGSQNIQGFQSAAAGKGIDSGQFLSDMTSFAQKVSEARTGVGEMATLFRLNGEAVGDVETSLLKVADLVANTTDEAKKFSIVQQAGLPANAEWVRFLEQGSDAIRSASSNAVKLTDEQIKAARDLDDRFNKMWDNFVRTGKRAIVDVADWMKEIDAAASRALLPYAMNRNAALANYMSNHGTQMDGARASEFYDSVYGKGKGAGGTAITVNAKKTVSGKEALADLNREQQRLSILGQTATVGEQVAMVENQIAIARASGISVTAKTAEGLKTLATERALGIDAIKAQVDAMNVEMATFGLGVGVAQAYTLVPKRADDAKAQDKKSENEVKHERVQYPVAA